MPNHGPSRTHTCTGHEEQYVMPNHGPSRTRACTGHACTRVLTQMHALTYSPRVRRERGASGAPAEQEAQLSAICHRRWEWTTCSIVSTEPRAPQALPEVSSSPKSSPFQEAACLSYDSSATP